MARLTAGRNILRRLCRELRQIRRMSDGLQFELSPDLGMMSSPLIDAGTPLTEANGALKGPRQSPRESVVAAKPVLVDEPVHVVAADAGGARDLGDVPVAPVEQRDEVLPGEGVDQHLLRVLELHAGQVG